MSAIKSWSTLLSTPCRSNRSIDSAGELAAHCDTPGILVQAPSAFMHHSAWQHARATAHPVIASAEPGERWLYCYPDEAFAVY
jgi:hypothetical protein